MPQEAKILIIDDDDENLRFMEIALVSMGHQVILTRNGDEALGRAKAGVCDLILLNSVLPGGTGFETARRLKADEVTRFVPLIVMTGPNETDTRVKALEAGADDFLTKPVDKTELRARVNSLLKVKALNEYLANYHVKLQTEVDRRIESFKQSLEKVKRASLDTIYRLSRAAEYKDEDTGVHIQRMSHYSTAIARQMGCDDLFLEHLLYSTPMHDIGKIGIPDRVLQKSGKLDPEEWEIMKRHTIIGAEILKDADVEFIKLGAEIALTHHEKWNGTGYPRGIKGTEIPLAGRIVAMADVFDALTSERPYKAAMPIEKAFAIIKEGRGSHFDPEVIDAFFAIDVEITSELNWWNFLGSDSSSS